MSRTGQIGKDPYRNFRFRVEIDGIGVAAFTDVTIPDTTTTSVEYREGTDANVLRKLSGLNKSSTVTLKKGLTDNMDIYNWRKAVIDKGADANRKNLSIILIDEEGNDKVRWDIINAWPIKYEDSALNSKGEDVVVESLEIVHEGITRTK